MEAGGAQEAKIDETQSNLRWWNQSEVIEGAGTQAGEVNSMKMIRSDPFRSSSKCLCQFPRSIPITLHQGAELTSNKRNKSQAEDQARLYLNSSRPWQYCSR